jgi:hypothetical protein
MISALERLRKEDGEFKASLGYIVSCCLKNPKKSKHKRRLIKIRKEIKVLIDGRSSYGGVEPLIPTPVYS